MTNFEIDVGMRKKIFTTASCPCSKKYNAWMDHLDVNDTLLCSKKKFKYTTIGGFMSHLLDIGMGKNNENIDLYHYITACYMFQLYGNKIGDEAIHKINGTSKQTKHKQLSCAVSDEAQNLKKVKGCFPVSKSN